MAEENLELQAKKMTKSSCDKFPPANVGDTIKLRVPDVDRGRCDPRNVLGVVTAVDGDKCLYKIGTKFGAINTTYARNQFTTCTEKIVAVEDVPEDQISLRACAGKSSLSGGQGYKSCGCKTGCRLHNCSCWRNKQLCNSKCHGSLACTNK